ncbi:MAG: DUF1566 domain-containing protein [Desulfobulbaceae bacterium]|nr:DUF1566 domain-containing protein [Desulfobulbaceae bacterium]
MRYLVVIVALVVWAMSSSVVEAYYLDTPHNESNGIYCYTCHEMSVMTLSEATWAARTASNPDDTMKNAVCNACHASTSVHPLKGPAKELHASSTTGATSTWSTECTQCHDVHSQGQLDWCLSDSAKVYLVTGEFMTANGARTYVDPNPAVDGDDYTIIGFNPDPTVLKTQTGWEDKSTWKAKGGNMDGGRAVDGSRGLILVPDKTNHVETFEIIDVVGNTIKVKGQMVKDAVNGGSFGIIYGQSLKSQVMPNGGSSAADYRDVKFFQPGIIPGSYGGFVDETAGSSKPLGLCQVCHTTTASWRKNGAVANHYPSTNCNSCHNIITGGSASGSTSSAGFDITLISGNTSEGGVSASFQVRLTSQPSGDVTVPVASSDLSEGTVDKSSLTFTNANWNQYQTVSVTGVSDNLADGDVSYQILLGPTSSNDSLYNGLNPSAVAVTNTDVRTAGFDITTISGNTSEAGVSATFQVRLTSQPTADVTIPVTSSGPSEGVVDKASLVFTNSNWDQYQTVNVTGVADLVEDGDVAYSIQLGLTSSADTIYNNLDPANVAVTNLNVAYVTPKLPDTGQVTSFTNTFGEDHDYSINPPSYVGHGNGTVTDNITALMWQAQDAGQVSTWEEANSSCNTLALAGYTDWRLPTIDELVALVNFDRHDPAVDPALFPETAAAPYWSATSPGEAPSDAWTVSFADGATAPVAKELANLVRCVRSSFPVNAPPVAEAGTNQQVRTGAVAHLNGSGSYDPEGDSLTYAWSFLSRPAGSSAQLANATSASPTFTADLSGTYQLQLMVNDGALSSLPATVTITAVMSNTPPVANPGGPYLVDLGGGASLNGSGSSDPDAEQGDHIVQFYWSIDGGSLNLSGVKPTLSTTQVAGLGLGAHTVWLLVVDSFGATSSATTPLTIYRDLPTAAFTATPNPAACGQAILFDGTLSSQDRPDRSLVDYAWNFGDGTGANGSSVNHAYGHFGSFTATLTVTDSNLPAKSASQSQTIAVNLGNRPPVANTGGPYPLTYGRGIRLDGSGSADPDSGCGDALVSYEWDLNNDGVYELTGAIVNLTWAQLGSYGLQATGDHPLHLRVTDSFGLTGSAYSIVTLNNTPPVAEAGDDLSGEVGVAVTLNGSASHDPDGDPIHYHWSVTAAPVGSTAAAALSPADAATVPFFPDVAGSYTITLQVSDGIDATTDTMTFTGVDVARAVPDTGQTGDYTATFGEDADFAVNPHSYVDLGDGTVLDNITGLTWQQQDDDTPRSHAAAASYCRTLTTGGSSDWRLPSLIELTMLVDRGAHDPAIDATAFPGAKAAAYWTATSSAVASPVRFGQVDFAKGSGGFVEDNGNTAYVRCVRD